MIVLGILFFVCMFVLYVLGAIVEENECKDQDKVCTKDIR